MALKGQNRPPKRIKFQEIVEEGEEDRISALPDCLLLEILSRLPSTKHAIRTGTLSKRWKHLWTLVPTLIFEENNVHYWRDIFDFVELVDETLTQCRQLKLKKFELGVTYDIAIRCNVEELKLTFWAFGADLVLDEKIFVSSCFTDLTLGNCILKPTGAISWKNLRSLHITFVEVDEDLIENILSGSPVLETLMLEDCYGFRRLNITTKSIKNLVFSGCTVVDYRLNHHTIEINAPNILSLTIKGDLFLWKVLLVNVSSLVKANLDYIKFPTPGKEDAEEMLKGFILNLRHVKDVKVGLSCSQALICLKAKGFIFPSNVKLPGNFLDHGPENDEGC